MAGAFGRVVRSGFASIHPCVCVRAVDGSLAVRKVCATFCPCFRSSRPSMRPSVHASVRPSARVDQGRDIVKILRNTPRKSRISRSACFLALVSYQFRAFYSSSRLSCSSFSFARLLRSRWLVRGSRWGSGRLWGLRGCVGVRVTRNARGAPRSQTRFYGGLRRVARVGAWLLVRFVSAQFWGFLAGLWGRRLWGRE